MTIPETSPPPAKARVIWIAALLLGSGLLLLTVPAWASDGFFEGPHTDTGLDTDADNRFEFLQVNVTVNVTVGGDFTVEGNLYDSLGITFITHNSTAFSGGVGVHVVTLNFEGPDIFGSRVDGPYRVTLDLLNDTMALVDGDVHITGPYSHVSFGPIFAFTPPHTDVGLDTDGNSLYNFIQVNISANTSLPGFFLIFGGIFSPGIMEFKIQVLNLTAGDHVIPLNFSGVGAFISGNDGPYDVFLSASVIACGQDPGPGDGSNHTTAAFFFTEFESAIKRDLTGSVTDGTTGMPVANETVWLANETHRWLTTFETNASGNFSFVAFEGDFVLMAGADGLQDQAIPITIAGDTNVDVALTEEPADVAAIGMTLTDWGNLTLDVVRWGYLDNQSQRFMVDQFVGNGDLIADASESQLWADVFFACFPSFNDTTGVFEVDGIGFQLNGTFGMDSDISGPVTSTAPIVMTQDGSYTAKSPVLAGATHQVLVNVGYDSENETEVFTLTLPKAWVLESFWAPTNVTVSGLNNNTVTVDPLGRPSGGPRAVDVFLNATLDTTPPVASNVSAAPDPQEIFGTVTITADVADNAGVEAVSVNITDPSGGTVCNCSMETTGAGTYTYAASFSSLGQYNFTVWAEDDAGLFASGSGNFTIQDTTAPTIGLTTVNPDPRELGQSVAFSVQVTDNDAVDTVTITIEDPDANPVSNVSMTFGGGAYTHTDSFDAPGTYSYTIWATDSSGNLASRSGTFVIQDSEPPTAAISGPRESVVDESFRLNASGSTDNHQIANYTWDLGDGTMAYGPTVTHAYDEAGDYTITLTVRDASGNEDTATLAITVLAAAPDGGGFQLSDTILYGLLAALAVGGLTAGVLYWRRGARAVGPQGPTPPKGGAQKEPPAKVAEKPPEAPPEPELDELDEEIEKLLQP